MRQAWHLGSRRAAQSFAIPTNECGQPEINDGRCNIEQIEKKHPTAIITIDKGSRQNHVDWNSNQQCRHIGAR